MVALIVSRGAATLHELRTIYSLEDAYLIWESVYIPLLNESLAAEDAASARRR